MEKDRKLGAWTLYVYPGSGSPQLCPVLTAEGTHRRDAGNGSVRARLLKARKG